MRKRFIVFVIVFVIVPVAVISIYLTYITGILLPYVPFYNYYGVEPLNDSWKNCQGIVSHMDGTNTVSDSNKKFDYWTVRAIKENNPNLCKNVGIYEGGDVIYSDEHKHAIGVCEYIFKNNPSFTNQCGNIY